MWGLSAPARILTAAGAGCPALRAPIVLPILPPLPLRLAAAATLPCDPIQLKEALPHPSDHAAGHCTHCLHSAATTSAGPAQEQNGGHRPQTCYCEHDKHGKGVGTGRCTLGTSSWTPRPTVWPHRSTTRCLQRAAVTMGGHPWLPAHGATHSHVAPLPAEPDGAQHRMCTLSWPGAPGGPPTPLDGAHGLVRALTAVWTRRLHSHTRAARMLCRPCHSLALPPSPSGPRVRWYTAAVLPWAGCAGQATHVVRQRARTRARYLNGMNSPPMSAQMPFTSHIGTILSCRVLAINISVEE